MKSNRMLAWSGMMKELAGPSSRRRSSVREEKIRTKVSTSLRQVPLSMWTGHSGKHYMMSVYSFNNLALKDVQSTVVMAVKRMSDKTDILSVICLSQKPDAGRWSDWIVRMQDKQATEIHVYHMAKTEQQRRDVMYDLRQIS